jgi:hypothetical protein
LSLVEALLPMAASKTGEWIRQMRDRHVESARPLDLSERAALKDYCDAEILRSVRVKEVSEIEKPPFYDALRSQLAFVGMRFDFDFTAVDGLTFDNCILIRARPLAPDLLFHELVHVEQYRQLGIPRFAAAYIRGFAENGFRYQEIPQEKIAFSLTERFALNETFSLREEVVSWLAAQKY